MYRHTRKKDGSINDRFVMRESDGAWVPITDPRNVDCRNFLAWSSSGGVIEEAPQNAESSPSTEDILAYLADQQGASVEDVKQAVFRVKNRNKDHTPRQR